MSYDIRFYRNMKPGKDLVPFKAAIKETDLLIMVDKESYRDELVKLAEELVWKKRKELEHFISKEPEFKTTMNPYFISSRAPDIAVLMARAGNQAGAGPMAAVAGAFAEAVGKELLKSVEEVIVENGGDIFMKIKKVRKVSIFCADSPFSNRLAIEISPEETPAGVCTSSGIVGPSYSEGKADAVVVVSSSTLLADAVATAVGNMVKCKEDVEEVLEKSKDIKGIKGILIVKDDKLGAWGKIKVVPQ